jgi:hypothetical protein
MSTSKLDDTFSFSVDSQSRLAVDFHVLLALTIAAAVPALIRRLHHRWRSKDTCQRQEHVSNGHLAASTPHGNVATTGGGASHYGLAFGELPEYSIGNGHCMGDDALTDIDDVTDRELRLLQASPQFRAWCRSKGLKYRDIEDSEQRLHIYRRLRTLHPASFWALCRPVHTVEQSGVKALPSMLEYLISNVTLISLGFALFWCFETQASVGAWVGCLALSWWLCDRRWAASRPAAGPLFGVWYEDTEMGHAVRAARIAVTAMIEGMYLVATLGVGGLISVVMRCVGGQSVAEMFMGIRPVTERKITAWRVLD